jgi:drug/metabolite transporter (DMT)-like permease
LLSLASLFWAGNFVVARSVSGTVPPVTLAFYRWVLAFALALWAARHVLRRDAPLLRAHGLFILVLAGLGIGAYNSLIYLGLQTTPALNALLMQSAMPLLILALSYALFGERPGRMQLLGVAVSVAGVVTIACHGRFAELVGLSLDRGSLWVLLAVLTYALYSALLRRRPAVHPLSFLAASFALGALMLAPLYGLEMARGARVTNLPGALLAVGYVALFPGFLSFLFYNRGVELIGANRSGQFTHLMPVFGSLLAMIFLGERFEPFHALGGVLIAGGIALASRSAAARAPASDAR